jgi:hypothetical protein
LAVFPEALLKSTWWVVHARREQYLGELRRRAETQDWLEFHKVLVEALTFTLQALFAASGVYYPGNKWIRQAMVRFGLDWRVVDLYDQLWVADTAHRIDVMAQLVDLVDAQGSTDWAPD